MATRDTFPAFRVASLPLEPFTHFSHTFTLRFGVTTLREAEGLSGLHENKVHDIIDTRDGLALSSPVIRYILSF